VYADLITSQGPEDVCVRGPPAYKSEAPRRDFYAEVKMILGESSVA